MANGKTLFEKIRSKELPPSDILFYNGIVRANSGLLRLAAEVERSRAQYVVKERE